MDTRSQQHARQSIGQWRQTRAPVGVLITAGCRALSCLFIPCSSRAPSGLSPAATLGPAHSPGGGMNYPPNTLEEGLVVLVDAPGFMPPCGHFLASCSRAECGHLAEPSGHRHEGVPLNILFPCPYPQPTSSFRIPSDTLAPSFLRQFPHRPPENLGQVLRGFWWLFLGSGASGGLPVSGGGAPACSKAMVTAWYPSMAQSC